MSGSKLDMALLFAGALLLAQPADAQEHPAEPHRHPEAQELVNPVEATSASVRSGRQRYVFDCRQCHGNSGRGDGDMSHAGGVPSDFTDDVWQHGESDGEIFIVIRDGVTADMQGYGDQLSDEEIWNLVNYIRTFAP
jgi:mono/diheme cytochrome c family protein